MGMAKNPFHWRGTVTDSTAFVGREREMVSIFARLRTLGCVSIVGDRRIGKSSLAYQACASATQKLGSEARAVYIDMLSSRHHTLDGLLGAVLTGLGAGEETALSGSGTEKLAAFEVTVRKLRQEGLLPVVVLDEFEGLASRVDQFGDDLLESWRSLGNDGRMAFVATSARPMEAVTKASELTSSFYNIFAQMKLGEFTEEEARAFARRAVSAGRLETGDDTFILRVGKQHPLRLQVAAWHVCEARQKDAVDFGVLTDEAEAEIAGMMKQQ